MLIKKKQNNSLNTYLKPLEKLKKKWSFYPNFFPVSNEVVKDTEDNRQLYSLNKEIEWKTAVSYITKKTLLQKQSNQLTIILNSYGTSQIKDIYSSITAIEKLIYSLNKFYAKSPSIYSVLEKKKLFPYANSFPYFFPFPIMLTVRDRERMLGLRAKDEKVKTNYKYLPVCNIYSTTLLRYQNPQMLFYNKQFVFDQRGLKERERGNYINRWFFKWSKRFGSFYHLNKSITQKLLNSRQLFTVIRAPFVFKKTREQFYLQRISYHITIEYLGSTQKDFLIQAMRLLKLPVELKIRIY